MVLSDFKLSILFFESSKSAQCCGICVYIYICIYIHTPIYECCNKFTNRCEMDVSTGQWTSAFHWVQLICISVDKSHLLASLLVFHNLQNCKIAQRQWKEKKKDNERDRAPIESGNQKSVLDYVLFSIKAPSNLFPSVVFQNDWEEAWDLEKKAESLQRPHLQRQWQISRSLAVEVRKILSTGSNQPTTRAPSLSRYEAYAWIQTLWWEEAMRGDPF